MKTLTQQEVIEMVKNNTPLHFKKSGVFKYEVATSQQEVVTSINGEKETHNTAYAGDYILTGASGEKYVIPSTMFQRRYKVLNTNEAKAKGECWGNEYKGEPFKFVAIWEEEMICNKGDYLVSPDDIFSEVYRIEKETFLRTYDLV